ncbi:hypothetical protein RRG08_024157 [Elysia crispata]|uniref:Uncharacterized protein n=1 Tax=Elysia crispata TaxID=231223 RepID=A0AAE0YR71_9GAST|nr:hypothetical protein RRG08_024157 [Elysia crispata]
MAQSSTPTGLFYDPKIIKRTLLALNEQRDMSQFCDVILKVCDTQIFAHSNVLAAASPYFGSFLGTGTDFPRFFSQKVPQIIEIHIDTKDGDDGYGEAVRKVIEYMYTSQITLTSSLISQIVEISKIMQMEALLLFCGQFQRGQDSNLPCDAASCTSGLEEVANLMSGRSKTRKHIDAATETDDSIFLKIENNTTNYSKSSELNSELEEGMGIDALAPNIDFSGRDLNMMNIGNFVRPEGKKGIPTALNNASASDQSEVSLLLEISKVRPPAQGNQLIDKNDPVEEFVEQISSHNQRPTDEYLKNAHTLADLMSIAGDKPEETACSDHGEDQSALQCQTVSKCPDNQTSITSVSAGDVRDINLEEISDLVKFGDFSLPLKECASSQTMSCSARRGRSRGRRRGRGGGRGRKVGRPKKTINEDHESDTEFDDFMERLERGEEISPEDETENSSQFEHSVYDSVENKSDDLSSGKLWTSRRKRKRPSQLRKDYVMHSLAKRSNKRVDSVKQNIANQTSPGLKFVCQKCDFSSSVFKDYRHHMKKHPETDPRNFKCDKVGCNFKTTRSREFTAHKHQHMTEELICIICEERSYTQDEFELHRKKHEGQNPYFCTECDSRFKTKAQLLAHKPKHQLEKPFVCAVCHAGFKWKHALKNHMVTHSATKDHLCDECGYATAHKSQLKSHMLIHTGLMFRCPYPDCNFQATKRQNLKYHMVTHTQEKPHQCEVCGQSFSLIKNMRRHMLLHTGARPFSCRLCGFSTTRYDKLKEHNQKLHNLNEGAVAAVQESTATAQLVTASDIPSQPQSDLQSNMEFVSPDEINGIKLIAKTGQDGSITQEALHTIVQLAVSENLSEATIIHGQGGDGNIYPLISSVELFEDADGVKYKLQHNMSG